MTGSHEVSALAASVFLRSRRLALQAESGGNAAKREDARSEAEYPANLTKQKAIPKEQ